ncbi:MAG: glucokinase [Pseudomonadota bacterium]
MPPVTQDTLLAGDIGGTKTILGLFSPSSPRPVPNLVRTYASRDWSGLGPIIQDFAAGLPALPARACFGIAGPVTGGVTQTTNLPWEVSEKALIQRFGFSRAVLVNDLAAMAMAIPVLDTEEVAALNTPAVNIHEPIALAAPGTGLGMALLIPGKAGFRVLASEGGHADFAPSSEDEADLWSFLHRRFGHVSMERVVSGPGIANIFNWLWESGRFDKPRWQDPDLFLRDPARAIVESALNTQNPLCIAVLNLFISALGALTGNLALTGMTTGGVFLGGGILPRILTLLANGRFLKSFTGKGRFSPFLSAIPVRVILNDKAALLGAALHAAKNL